jgi:hypothetical protein
MGVRQKGHCLVASVGMKLCEHSLPMRWPQDASRRARHGGSLTESDSPKGRRQTKQLSPVGEGLAGAKVYRARAAGISLRLQTFCAIDNNFARVADWQMLGRQYNGL